MAYLEDVSGGGMSSVTERVRQCNLPHRRCQLLCTER